MERKDTINTTQFVWLLFSVITSFTSLQIPGMLVSHAGHDSWLSVLGAWVLDVLLAIVYAYMGLRFPGQNLMQYSVTILGKYIGSIVGVIFAVYFLFVASFLMRSLAAMIVNVFLPQTPIEVILITSYILISYAVKEGIESIARTCAVLGPIYLISLTLLFLLLIPQVKVENFKPMFSQGVSPFLTGIPFILSFIGICIIMGMYIPICNRLENGFRSKFIAVSIGAFIVISLILLSIGIFGAEQTGKMLNPSITIARIAKISPTIQRMEVIWLIIGSAAGVMTSTNLVWAFSLGISQLVGLRSYKPLVYPAALLAFVLSLTSFRNSTELFDFTFYSYIFIGIFVQTGLEMLLFFAALVLKKRGQPL